MEFDTFQGFGPNPNYGYTTFDNIMGAYLCAFRLMTQDTGQSIIMSAGQSVPKTTLSMPTASMSIRRAGSLWVRQS